MLKKIATLVVFFISLNAFACWKGEGSFAVDGETWKIDQKFEHNKEYFLPMGPYIVRLTVKSEDKKKPTLLYTVHEKKGNSLVLVTKGEEDNLVVGETRDVYAKGAEGQPNSIITLKLIHI